MNIRFLRMYLFSQKLKSAPKSISQQYDLTRRLSASSPIKPILLNLRCISDLTSPCSTGNDPQDVPPSPSSWVLYREHSSESSADSCSSLYQWLDWSLGPNPPLWCLSTSVLIPPQTTLRAELRKDHNREEWVEKTSVTGDKQLHRWMSGLERSSYHYISECIDT